MPRKKKQPDKPPDPPAEPVKSYDDFWLTPHEDGSPPPPPPEPKPKKPRKPRAKTASPASNVGGRRGVRSRPTGGGRRRTKIAAAGVVLFSTGSTGYAEHNSGILLTVNRVSCRLLFPGVFHARDNSNALGVSL